MPIARRFVLQIARSLVQNVLSRLRAGECIINKEEIMFILVYGADGTGKSVQCKNILEASESAEHWSFATKNRKLYETSGVISEELLRFNNDSTINPYTTIDAFHDKIAATVSGTPKTIVIDEITLLRKWAQPVVIEEINKQRRAYNKPPVTKIGESNYTAWARVNEIVYGKLELLANWSEMSGGIVLAISSIVEERRMVQDSDSGETKSVTTGNWIVDAKENIRKLADVRVRLEKDGRNGRGYYAIFEKCQDWMTEGKESVKIDKDGLLTEFAVRGIL